MKVVIVDPALSFGLLVSLPCEPSAIEMIAPLAPTVSLKIMVAVVTVWISHPT